MTKQTVCSVCGGVFIGHNIHSISYVNVSKGPPIPIDKFMLQTCSRAVNKANCLTNCLSNTKVITQRPNYNKGFLSPTQIDDIATSILSEHNVVTTDKYVSIDWIEGARKFPISVDSKYCPTVYIEEVNVMLSVIIEFMDSINEGYLSFLMHELVNEIDLSGMIFNLYEGEKVVAKGRFK